MREIAPKLLYNLCLEQAGGKRPQDFFPLANALMLMD
jgi:hypothetical protein